MFSRLARALVPPTLALLLTGAAMRWLIPPPGRAGAGALLTWLGELGERQGALVAGAFFILFLALLRPWLPAAPAPAAPERPWSGRPGRSALRLALGVVAAASAGIALRRGGLESLRVVSGSMLPGLLPGDRLLVNKVAVQGKLPRRGDVIVFRAPEIDGGPPELVKRVVGLPGDRVTMDGGARPVINGQPVPVCDAGTYVYFGPGNDRVTRGRLMVEWLDGKAYLAVHEPGAPAFVAHLVGPGELFVLGDNRGLSNDSRSWQGQSGAGVPLAAVVGRVERVLTGTTRDGRLDLMRLWRSLGPDLHLSGVDVRQLQAGVAHCLKSGGPGPGATLSRS